jgi:hypothetical protein
MKTLRFSAILLIVLWLFPIQAVSEGSRIGVLPDILVPAGLHVKGSEVFVLEGATVFVFELPSLELKRRFGREGQGPGELEITPWLSNTLTVRDDKVILDSSNKLVVFSDSGQLIRERKRRPQFTQVVPWGGNYAVRYRVPEPENNMQYSTIQWLGDDTDDTRELYRQPFAGQRELLDMIPDSIHFQVYENNLYIEKSPEGFVIDVYGHDGGKLHEIRIDETKLRVTPADRLDYERLLRGDPMMNIQEENWEQFKSRTRLRYPEFFPAIRDFVISGGRIYVQTYRSEGPRDEFLVLDMTGKLHRRINLPKVRESGFTEQMMGTGVRLYVFDGETYYYLVETAEGVELHAEKITR